MDAGYGKAEITPPLGVELAGYGYYLQRRAARVSDALYVRTLYLQSGAARWLLVSCDLLGLSRSVCDAVYASLLAEHGLSRAQVMIVSIHTHTGPAVKYHEGCGQVNEAYVSALPAKILDACGEAIRDADTVLSLSYHEASLDGHHARNRAEADGPVDDMARGFSFARALGKPIALSSYACHAVSLGRVNSISADYPGRVNALLEAEGFDALYVNGLCGDIDPLFTPGEDRAEGLKAFARSICAAFLRSSKPCGMAFKSGRLPHALRLLPMTPEDIRKAGEDAVQRGGGVKTGAGRVAHMWMREMLCKAGGLPAEEPIDIAYARIGRVWIVALPVEGFTETACRVRAALSGTPAIVLGCAEELLGYLPTRGDIDRASYAALDSPFLYKRLPSLAGEAERMGDEIGRMLREEARYESD